MKTLLIFTALLLVLGSADCHAETNTPVPAQSAPPADKHSLAILKALKLSDGAAETKVQEIIAAQFRALSDWHERNDAQIKPLWNQFNAARSKNDTAAADAALAKIDSVYATFKPRHDEFLARLGKVLTPDQVELVKDTLTVNKVQVTFHAYEEIFPGLTAAQKAVVLQNLKAAREEAIDASAMAEKSAFFKKYKIKIEEGYLTAQGYDPKQARKDFAAKQKPAAAKKSGDQPAQPAAGE